MPPATSSRGSRARPGSRPGCSIRTSRPTSPTSGTIRGSITSATEGTLDGSLIVVPLRGRAGAIGVLTIERLGVGNTFTQRRVRTRPAVRGPGVHRPPERGGLPGGGAARPDRRPDRAAQPRDVRGSARVERACGRAIQPDHAGPRRLPGRQQLARPPGRRRAAARHRIATSSTPGATATRSSATAATSSRSCCPGPMPRAPCRSPSGPARRSRPAGRSVTASIGLGDVPRGRSDRGGRAAGRGPGLLRGQAQRPRPHRHRGRRPRPRRRVLAAGTDTGRPADASSPTDARNTGSGARCVTMDQTMRVRWLLVAILRHAARDRLRPGTGEPSESVGRRRRCVADTDPDARRTDADPVVRAPDTDPRPDVRAVHGQDRRHAGRDRQAVQDDGREHRVLEPRDLPVAGPGFEQVRPDRIEVGWVLQILPGETVDPEAIPELTPRPTPRPTLPPPRTAQAPPPDRGGGGGRHGRRPRLSCSAWTDPAPPAPASS